MKQYRQCRLRKDTTETTGWIEERGATVGASVQITKPEALAGWWEVLSVGENSLPEDMLKEHQRLHRNSLPSVEGIAR